MSDTSLRTLLISIVLGLFVVTVAYTFISDFSSKNNVTSDPNMDNIYKNFSEQLDSSIIWADGFQNSSGSEISKLTDTGGEASVIKSLYVSIKLPFEQGKVAQSSLSIVASMLGIPRYVYFTALSVIIILFTVIFIGLVTRTRAP